MIKVESYFEFLANDDNELILLCESDNESPHQPVIIYDGEQTALLQRGNNNTKKLVNIDKNVSDIIKQNSSLLVVEINKGTEDITYTYPAAIKILKRLP